MTMYQAASCVPATWRKHHFALMVGVFSLAIAVPVYSTATTLSDEAFRNFLTDLCSGNVVQPPGTSWNVPALASLCEATGGGAGGGPGTTASNLGTVNAGSGVTVRKRNAARDRLDEDDPSPPQGASADGGRWGLLVSPQYGKGDRDATERENGFRSDLLGISIGADYRASHNLVFGVLAGLVQDDAKFLGGAGSIDARTGSLHVYGTWLPGEQTSIDGYLGAGRIVLETLRRATFGTLDEFARGDVAGRQVLGGISANIQIDRRPASLSFSANLDAQQTRFDGYDETGTGLALRFAERTTRSVTATLAAGLSTPRGFNWGSLTPSLRIAAVHEFQNDARKIRNELVSAPGVGVSIDTDAPDRNYGFATLAIVAAQPGGTQTFLNYERRFSDRLFDAWSVSLGILTEY